MVKREQNVLFSFRLKWQITALSASGNIVKVTIKLDCNLFIDLK